MDLEEVSPALQQLIIAASVDRIMEKQRNVIIVLPEARDFIPEDRKTPVKLSIENLIRKGAKLGNYLWLDSQSLTGLDMDVMRNIGTWLFGRQDLDLEAERSAKMIPRQEVKHQDIESLGIGQFYFRQGDTIKKVYVQPGWASDTFAINVAKGAFAPDYAEKRGLEEKKKHEHSTEIDEMDLKLKEENERLTRLVESQAKEIVRLKEELASKSTSAPSLNSADRIEIETREVQVKITNTEPDVRSFTTGNIEGKIVFVLVKDLNGESTQPDIISACAERGWALTQVQTNIPLGRLTQSGTLIKFGVKPFRYRIPGKLKVETEVIG